MSWQQNPNLKNLIDRFSIEVQLFTFKKVQIIIKRNCGIKKMHIDMIIRNILRVVHPICHASLLQKTYMLAANEKKVKHNAITSWLPRKVPHLPPFHFRWMICQLKLVGATHSAQVPNLDGLMQFHPKWATTNPRLCNEAPVWAN